MHFAHMRPRLKREPPRQPLQGKIKGPATILAIALALLPLVGCGQAPRTWVCYYGLSLAPELLQTYGLIVVDSAYPGSIAVLKQKKLLYLPTSV